MVTVAAGFCLAVSTYTRNKRQTVIFLGTHDTNRDGHISVNVGILNQRDEFEPICHCLVESERTDLVTFMWQELYRISPGSCASIQILMGDTTHVW